MGNLAHEMVRKATDSVITANPALANEVIATDDAVDRIEREVTLEAITFVVQESPVAADLRFVVSTLGVVGEIEEVADDAVKLARRSLKLGTSFPQAMKIPLQEMSESSRQQLMSAIRLYTEFDADLARSIVDRDNEIDSAYSQARDSLLELLRKDSSNPGMLVRTIEVFHALEHVSDHAVSIAKRMQIIDEPGV